MRTLRLPLRKRLVALGLATLWNAQGDRHQLDERNALRLGHGVELGGQRLANLLGGFSFSIQRFDGHRNAHPIRLVPHVPCGVINVPRQVGGWTNALATTLNVQLCTTSRKALVHGLVSEMNVQTVLGHRLNHQLFEFGGAGDGQCAAEPLPGQLEGHGHPGFGNTRAAHGDSFARVHKQGLVGLLVQVMHVLAELGLACVKVLGAEVTRALTGGGWINLFGKAIHDPLHTFTHAFRAWAPRAADAEAWVFFFIV
ncbi:hypothetical protein ALP36_200045 [Pseudomonas syringae pv. coriandricola]|uniref:Uncharacterized protein n=1 Tax=Pseudomonas syringae pv. coriandricola TaxID=264453 RepID=A0A3M5RTH7_9PSED|nr:hypothetical protein ALP87_200110 [Pseudomonas syringae pv. coriandricola]RMU11887.1 hypothetical protein ALP36_200045 [Pseudomonas syringae pv. coriandricola]